MFLLTTALVFIVGFSTATNAALSSGDFVLYSQTSDANVKSVYKKMRTDDSMVLIDVREPEEWRQGVIPHAKLVTRAKLPVDIINIAPNKEAEIVLYCRSGYRSQLAADTLLEMGYKNVRSMSGGIKAWQKAGFKIEK